jgi:WXG100 family type VII secretion target
MTLRVQHDAMRTAVSDVQRAHQDLVVARTDADRRVASLLGAGWTGVAADAFSDAWQDWLTGAAQVEDGLEAMGQLLDAVHRDLVQQDDASQAALDQLSARIVDRLG